MEEKEKNARGIKFMGWMNKINELKSKHLRKVGNLGKEKARGKYSIIIQLSSFRNNFHRVQGHLYCLGLQRKGGFGGLQGTRECLEI